MEEDTLPHEGQDVQLGGNRSSMCNSSDVFQHQFKKEMEIRLKGGVELLITEVEFQMKWPEFTPQTMGTHGNILKG